jgi:hypothetical protein
MCDCFEQVGQVGDERQTYSSALLRARLNYQRQCESTRDMTLKVSPLFFLRAFLDSCFAKYVTHLSQRRADKDERQANHLNAA